MWYLFHPLPPSQGTDTLATISLLISVSIGQFGQAAECSPTTIQDLPGAGYDRTHTLFMLRFCPCSVPKPQSGACWNCIHSPVCFKSTVTCTWQVLDNSNTFYDIFNLLEILRIGSTSSSNCSLVLSSNLSMEIQTVWISLYLLGKLQIFAHRWPLFKWF